MSQPSRTPDPDDEPDAAPSPGAAPAPAAIDWRDLALVVLLAVALVALLASTGLLRRWLPRADPRAAPPHAQAL